MSDSNIFTGQGTPADQQGGTATPPNDQSNTVYADLLNSIKNERGEPKYKDVQTALDALKHSQEFIPQVKTENEQLKAELEKARAEAARIRELEDTLARLTSGQAPQQTTPATQGLDAEAIAKLVTQTLERKQNEEKSKANTQAVVKKMSEAFGSDAEKVFYSKAQEVGLTVEQVNSLASTSPQAVLKMFGLDAVEPKKTSFPSPSSGTVNTTGYQPKQESLLGRNKGSVVMGASTDEVRQERENAKALVEELHTNNLSTYDLTDPKMYFRYFK